MNRLTIVALAWALVHFIWQGGALALLAGFACAAMRRAGPATRYIVFTVALAAMALAPAVTFLVMRFPPAVAPEFASTGTAVVGSLPAAAAVAPAVRHEAATWWLVWLVRIWLGGVLILGLNALGGWAFAQRLKRRKTSPAAPSVERAANDLRTRFGIRRAVSILASAAAEVPATLGWLRPVVLIPVSALTALTPEQIELLIAHELAHVRRYDYLVNLAQTAVETVLFYHPAVWWVSGRMRIEREHCCDDLAVGACGNVASYVGALAALEGLRSRRPIFVIAADGGSLLERIRRLAGRDPRQRQAPPAWLGALVPAAVVLASVVAATPPQAIASPPPVSKGDVVGFLGELADAGYPKLSVDEIIALKDHGVDPSYVKGMLLAGLGVPGVSDLVRLHDHGVEPSFVAGIVTSGLVNDLDFRTVIRLRENDARGGEMGRIRALGFGPFSADEVIRLRQNGVDDETFEALKEAGADHAGVQDAVAFRQDDVTVDRIRDMKQQGFDHLSVAQILKLRRAGII